jgi:hypothetical protein
VASSNSYVPILCSDAPGRAIVTMANFLMLAYPKPMVASGKTSNCGPAYAGGVFSLWHVGAEEGELASALQSVRLGVCIVAIFYQGRLDEPASRGTGRQAGTMRLIIS